jgi:hypothetical protein
MPIETRLAHITHPTGNIDLSHYTLALPGGVGGRAFHISNELMPGDASIRIIPTHKLKIGTAYSS